MSLPIALQLWSVKEDAEKDFFDTLEKVASMGYDGVEFAGYHGKNAQEIKAKLKELGLKIAGSHISMEEILQDTDKVIKFEQELGNKYIVCPWASFPTLLEWDDFAEKLQQTGAKLAAAGMSLLYHNHNHELASEEGPVILDRLFEAIPASCLNAELDTYWLEYAGVNAIDYMDKWTGRTPLIHVKDMDSSKRESTEIGNGSLNIKGIVEKAYKNGTEWLIVEQEAFTQAPLTSVEIGLHNLRRIVADL
ncbi:sugar phosphate isomerase/epimerase [Niallia circulans]|uniref:Sugar phosphate isomerase/epimerase n=1 Tax=Niallia circulans TaxID=1397 RepID=A0A553SMB7_NIACI|nr:sugar phosphate isomerase/epimerase [Niallia circulans]TRZ38126.1 sugar phosphate isomerase/epimerase [Niallia circulans]